MNHVTEMPAADPVRAVAHFTDKLWLETDCSDVHAAMQTRDPGFVVLDVRGPDAYAHGHVPGAVNLPHRTTSDETLKRWPAGTLFVVYCGGPHCNGADKAVAKLAAHGKGVKLMLGGITGWQDEGFGLATG
jgi:rhodanese-related sulfurtransferase